MFVTFPINNVETFFLTHCHHHKGKTRLVTLQKFLAF